MYSAPTLHDTTGQVDNMYVINRTQGSSMGMNQLMESFWNAYQDSDGQRSQFTADGLQDLNPLFSADTFAEELLCCQGILLILYQQCR